MSARETAEELLNRMAPEADEVDRARRHVEAAIKLHRAQCQSTDPRGCGMERRLLALFDRAHLLEREYTACCLEVAARESVQQ